MVITQRLWSESISRSSSETPGIFMASTIASTTALSRPSEKLGTHSTSVDITGKNKGSPLPAQLDGVGERLTLCRASWPTTSAHRRAENASPEKIPAVYVQTRDQ